MSNFLDNEAWATLHSHPAQSSIGWDVIWTSLSFIAWISLLRPDSSGTNKYGRKVIYLVLSASIVSIAVTAPYALQRREDTVEGVRGTDSEEKKI